MTKADINKLKKHLEKSKDSLAKLRDTFRDIKDEVEVLEQVCEAAYNNLEWSVQGLSELV